MFVPVSVAGLSRRLLPLLLVALFAVPACAEEAEPWTSWQNLSGADHPLTGKIWSAGEQRFVTPDELAGAVREARFVLLGEVHDNADVHRLQAWLVAKAAEGRRPAVVWEMIPRDKAEALESYLAKPGATAAGLAEAVDWDTSGWPAWRIYQPIAEAALARGLPIRAGDPERALRKQVGTAGLNALTAEGRKALLVERPLGKSLGDALIEELYNSHCEMVPRTALGPMSDIQRLRDAVLADSLAKAAGDGSAILIAGNGHVRSDRGVPWYLSQRIPGASISTVMLLEVETAVTTPQLLIPTAPDGTPAADYAWFVPRAERDDPCEELRKRFGK